MGNIATLQNPSADVFFFFCHPSSTTSIDTSEGISKAQRSRVACPYVRRLEPRSGGTTWSIHAFSRVDVAPYLHRPCCGGTIHGNDLALISADSQGLLLRQNKRGP